MDDSTIGHPLEEPIGEKRPGLSRRQVGVAAAWALPVIAAATAAPLASASVGAPEVNLAIQQAGGSGGSYTGAVTAATFEFESTIASASNTLTATLVIAPSSRVTVTDFNDPVTHLPFGSSYTYGGYTWAVTIGTNTITLVATNVSVVVGANTFNLPLPEVVGTLSSTGLVSMTYSAVLDNPEVFASGAAGYSVTYTP